MGLSVQILGPPESISIVGVCRTEKAWKENLPSLEFLLAEMNGMETTALS
jgi:hypothetical protein